MKTFLITGGRGFIGSHFVEHCLQKGHAVIDIDCMTYAASSSLPWDNNPNYRLINENICNLTHIPMCDVIVNFAAESHVDNSIVSPDIFVKSNINGVFNILNLLRGKVYERPRFVHISTDEVYGDVNIGEKTEDSILNPGNPYAGTKAAADMLVLSYAKTFGIDYQIVRSTNNYGERQYPEKLIPRILHSIKNNKKIPIHGDGSYVRDWLYVKDNVEAIYQICNINKMNEIWNVCAYNYRTNLEVVQEVCSWFGMKDYTNLVDFIPNRLGQDYRYSISSEKLKNNIDWKPSQKSLYNFL